MIRHTAMDHLVFGELDGTRGPRLERLLEFCRLSGFQATLSDHIEIDIWSKFVRLSTFSGLTAVTRSPVGPLRDDPDLFAMLQAAAMEAMAVARAKGIPLTRQVFDQMITMVQELPPNAKSSMLEDLERGKPLELPWLSGAVVRIGAEVGVETPIHRFIATVLTPHVSGSTRRARVDFDHVHLAVFDRAPPEPRLEDVARLFEHATRRGVPRERHGIHPRELVCLDRMACHGGERLGRDAASPEPLSQPIPDLRRHAFDIGMEHEPDATYGFVIHRDGERRFGNVVVNMADEPTGVALRVRVRKPVAQVQPDLAIVRVGDKGVGIGRAPRADLAGIERQFHKSTLSRTVLRAAARPDRAVRPSRCSGYRQRGEATDRMGDRR